MQALWTPSAPATSRARAAPADPPLSRSPRKKALLIGCNYYGTPYQLSGCINDVLNVKAAYAQRLHVTDFRVLTDAPGAARGDMPTRANILASLEWLIAGCQAGDVLLLHYSGHGTYVPDANGNERVGTDSCIVPLDYSQAGPIVDDQLRASLCDLLPLGVTLFAVFDSCYSGTVLDLRYSYLDDSSGPTRAVAVSTATRRAVPNLAQWRAAHVAQENLAEPETAASIVMLSGCSDEQTSADAYINATYQGAMTWSLMHVLESVHLHGLPLAELLMRVRALLQTNGYAQIPQITSGQLLDCNVPLGRLLATPI